MSHEPTDPAERLDPVEELIVECLETSAGERASTVERLCSAHPDLAGELRQRLASLDEALLDLSATPDELPERLGDFRILRRLGGGGMGVVHEARQESLGRVVALKLIRPEHLWFGRSRDRFRREIEAVARLEHPGIVPVHVVGEEGGVPFFAMERVQGCTVAEALRKLGDTSPDRLRGLDLARAIADDATSAFGESWTDACVSITRQVAEALHHAHTRGVVHRDVKPSNIMLSADGRARLIDFGLTREADGERVTRTGAVMGTVPYTAPEQLRDPRAADARSDVYSLGATLYEMLTLRPPFADDSTPAALAQIMQGGADPVRTHNRRVAADVEAVCRVAMDVDPARRYADAAAFARDLAHLEARRPIEARPPGAILRARRLGQRHPVWATAIALATAVAIGLPTALYLQASAHAEELGASLQAAERKRDETERAVRFLTDLLHSVSPFARPGPAATVSDLLAAGSDTVDEDLADHPYARGLMQLNLAQVSLDFSQAERALDLQQRALESFARSDEPDVPAHVATTRLSMAEALSSLGRVDEAEVILREEAEAGRQSGDPEQIQFALGRLASLLSQLRPAEACAVHEELMPLIEANPVRDDSLAMNRINYAIALVAADRVEEAEAQARLGLADIRELFEPPHPRLAQSYATLASVLDAADKVDDAAQLYHDAIDMARIVWGEHSSVAAKCHNELAKYYHVRGKLEEAEEHGRSGLEITRAATADDAPWTEYARMILGRILEARGKYDEAVPLLERAIAFEREASYLGPHRLATALHHLARAYAGLDRVADAEQAYDESIAVWEDVIGEPDQAEISRVERARLREKK